MIHQVTAECSETEQLLDKLCDVAFITGKGEKKTCETERSKKSRVSLL